MKKAFSFTTKDGINVTTFKVEDSLMFTVLDLNSEEVASYSVKWNEFVEQLNA
jgi:hypothetical protein